MRKNNLEHIIVEHAYDLFKKKGFDNVSVMEICQACDITKPTFYKHVNSKEDLLSYFFQSLTTEIPEDWYKYSDETNFWIKIRDGFVYFLGHAQEIGLDLYTAAFIANLRFYRGTFDDVPSFKEEVIDLIRLGQQSKQILNESDPEYLYSACVALCVGYGAYWCFSNDSAHDLIYDFVIAMRNMFRVDEKYVDPAFRYAKKEESA
ncbi:TetR/AcrR family transcriptional regulator [uncultured Dubosiella sp.]|uniref:TetR/AcrR family transcriptional regulator n=2 Tax=uncultured Dubosiella sp. TaxID=1937011 RepID=UPI002630BDB4|nr:TetR/AcrR family transcriptional regulator [uncultured Dubosiella sp.]